MEEKVGNQPADMYLGDYGGFDCFAYDCCRKYKEIHPNISLVFVTPYLTADYQEKHLENQQTRYDAILYPEIEDKPKRYAITYQNKYMVEKAQKMVEEGKMPINKANRKTRQHFAKIAAAILLNEKTKIILFWWIKWRIIYYRWNITADDYLKIMAEAKKKGQAREYLVAMAFSMTMADIWTMMTKKEAEAFLRELNSANAQQQ